MNSIGTLRGRTGTFTKTTRTAGAVASTAKGSLFQGSADAKAEKFPAFAALLRHIRQSSFDHRPVRGENEFGEIGLYDSKF